MSRKQKGILVLILACIIGISVYFSQRMVVPDDFLSEQEILAGLPLENLDKEIQDIIQIDEKTYFVPYIADENVYSTSIFKWLDGKWTNVSESTWAGPLLLQADSEPYVFWNIHPGDNVENWELYFLYSRDYSLSYPGSEDEKTFYMPHIQVSETISKGEESYGYAPLPVELKNTVEAVTTNPKSPPETLSFSMKYPLSWQAHNSEGEAVILEKTRQYGGGGRYGGDYVSMLNELIEEELE
ncbi:hypothetical protein E2R51_09085 [Jeotgalibacillus sp. S-D1]|uniref:hypothetical protein n=1 Tax=Jeotgalibacillus sp. S-D1 TaxID=2552189 RepID=UPI001059A227|nr:hypothetical protein [Jeotgalibacillus sp. S-D1]TDL32814.1 hypothetical protein E2R51_09085 [Jeotgalibacillus sp. S-D1]